MKATFYITDEDLKEMILERVQKCSPGLKAKPIVEFYMESNTVDQVDRIHNPVLVKVEGEV